MVNGNLPPIVFCFHPPENLQNIPYIAFSLATLPNCYILNNILHLEGERHLIFVSVTDPRREMIGSCIKELLKSIYRKSNLEPVQITCLYFDFACFLKTLIRLGCKCWSVDIVINGDHKSSVIWCLWVRNNCCDNMQTLVSRRVLPYNYLTRSLARRERAVV